MAARLTTFVVVSIVAATLIAGLIVGAQREDNDGPVDLIVHNAKVYTATRDGVAEAVAIRGNQILRVGTEREINRLRRPQTLVIDAKGASVLPGFNDAHVEFLAAGVALDLVDLNGASTVEEIAEHIGSWAEANPDRPWVLGRGWHADTFDGGPTRHVLDRVVPDRPARIVSEDGHASWANTKALAAARITRRTVDPKDGTIVRDAKTGEPTGLLIGSAMALVEAVVPALTREDREQALRAAIAEAHRYGITSVQDSSSMPDELAAYAEARRTGDLTVRVYSALPIEGDPTDAALDALEGITSRYPDDPVFKAGGVSITLDGPFETHAAAMNEPYGETAALVDARLTADDLNRIVRRLDARRWQILTNATGDTAVRMALNAYEHAARSNPSRTGERRHRIEHADFVAEADVPRFQLLGVLASMQPFRGSPVVDETAVRSRYLAAHPATAVWAADRIRHAGARLAFSSGWPSGPLNPLIAIQAALSATAGDAVPAIDRDPSEHLPLGAAIDAYTSGAAWASFDEQRKGTIAPGMLADIVVLSDDIFTGPLSKLGSTSVAVTIFDGKIVYRRGEHSTN
jgi:predicted amidohydrolase YtcJ